MKHTNIQFLGDNHLSNNKKDLFLGDLTDDFLEIMGVEKNNNDTIVQNKETCQNTFIKNNFDKKKLCENDRWSIQEDILLLQLQNTYGNHWKSFCGCFYNRSMQNLKSRFQSIYRSAKRQWSQIEDFYLLHLRNEKYTWDEIKNIYIHRSSHCIKRRYREIVTSKNTIIIDGNPENVLLVGIPNSTIESIIQEKNTLVKRKTNDFLENTQSKKIKTQ